MEPRLEKRYKQLVRAHMQPGHELAAGVKSALNENIAFKSMRSGLSPDEAYNDLSSTFEREIEIIPQKPADPNNQQVPAKA